jgi:Xaa-Pro aminopeptidase
MERAAAISREAHIAAMAATRPGMFEYEIEALLRGIFRGQGAERPAYAPIVGSGPNATVLHYRANNRKMEPGDLLLIDAGCEFGYYASDVTRTFPVNGTFSSPQRELYEIVLAAQDASIGLTRPGATLEELHAASVRVVTEGLVALGIVGGPVADAMESERYKKYFMHKTSHYLGMDVHDVGAYFVDGTHRPLDPGVVITVEPGIYVPADDTAVAERYRGIGIRIEDDILVTAEGHRVISDGVPKTVAEVERACAA